MKKRKWQPRVGKIKKIQISDERFEQLLAEVGEILYKRLCQLEVQDKSLKFTEPVNLELEKNQFKKTGA